MDCPEESARESTSRPCLTERYKKHKRPIAKLMQIKDIAAAGRRPMIFSPASA